MLSSLKTALGLTVIWVIFQLFVGPTIVNWRKTHYSYIRLETKAPSNYAGVFIRADTPKRFQIPWLHGGIRPEKITLACRLHGAANESNFMLINPLNMTCGRFAIEPRDLPRMTQSFDSPQVVLELLRTQPGITPQSSHTNDAVEVFEIVRSLASRPLHQFVLPEAYPLQNFTIQRQVTARSYWPGLKDYVILGLFWAPFLYHASRQGIIMLFFGTAHLVSSKSGKQRTDAEMPE